MNNPEIDQWLIDNKIFEKQLSDYLKLFYGRSSYLPHFRMHNNMICDYSFQYEKEFWEGIKAWEDFSKINSYGALYQINNSLISPQPYFIGATPDKILKTLQKIHKMKVFQ